MRVLGTRDELLTPISFTYSQNTSSNLLAEHPNIAQYSLEKVTS